MKKLINLIIVCLITLSATALDVDRIKNEVRKDININHFSKSRVILETGFGSSKFMDAEAYQELVGKDIMKVNLIYTTYREADDFDQINLNEKRWSNLLKLMPNLKGDENIKFNEIGIDKCKLQKCAENQLHGFIIEYKKEVFNYTNLEIQSEFIQCDIVNEIKGEKGTKVKIPANAFVDLQGNDVKGMVEVKLREALNIEDIVLAKLLTITADFQPLESGGMVQVDAMSNGRRLKLKDGKSISISIPKKTVSDHWRKQAPDMKVWEGVWIDGQLQWQNPELLVDSIAKPLSVNNPLFTIGDSQSKRTIDEEGKDKWRLLPSITIDSGQSPKSIGKQVSEVNFHAVNSKLDEVQIITTEDTLQFCEDDYLFSTGQINGLSDVQAIRIQRWFENGFIPQDIPFDFWGWNIVTTTTGADLGGNNSGNRGIDNQNIWVSNNNGNQNLSTGGARNMSYVSSDMAYAINTTNLGWVNIDRLATFPNSKRAKLEILSLNDSTINEVEISLIIPKRNIFLPGYKMNSGNYCFSHGDNHQNYALPVGDKAFVIMMGSQEDQEFSAIKEITLGKKEIEETKFVPKDKSATLKEIKKLI